MKGSKSKMTPEQRLQQSPLKMTPQRLVILKALCCQPHHHPTADEVFEAVQEALPVALSRATVYNTLNAFVSEGLIKEVSLEPGRTRYDANLSDHHHFIDTQTGRIYDIPWEQVSQLCESLGPEYAIHDYQITFWGVCAPKSNH